MQEAIARATAPEIERLEHAAGPWPASYREFLEWMGDQCPFLTREELQYSPKDLLANAYEDSEVPVAEGFIVIGIDTSGNALDVHLRRSDGSISIVGENYEAKTNEEILPINDDFESYLLTCYIRKTL